MRSHAVSYMSLKTIVFSEGFEDIYIYEYASEFGFLRMSPKTRQKLNITTTFVVLGKLYIYYYFGI